MVGRLSSRWQHCVIIMFQQSIKWHARKQLSWNGYDNLIDITYLNCWQGGCRTGMAKVTNAYDLPARFVYRLPFFPFQSRKLLLHYNFFLSPRYYSIIFFVSSLGERKLRMSLSQCCCILMLPLIAFEFWLYIMNGICDPMHVYKCTVAWIWICKL